jgi:hypothetical protein
MEEKRNIEFRVMPNGDGKWYWEVILDGRDVAFRGLSDSEPHACKDAGDAAREAKLIE